MNFSKINCLISSFVFVTLFINAPLVYSQNFIVTGKANNAKLGAVVVTESNEVYYIDKLEYWSSDFIEKTVRVTGKLVTKKIEKADSISGGITSPSMKVIKRYSVEVVSD